MSRTLNGHLFNVFLLSVTMIFLSCKRGPETQDPFTLQVRHDIVEEFEDIRWSEHRVEILEVVPTAKYAYIRVKEDSENYWVASSPGNFVTGKEYVFNEAVVKYDFKSPSLDRVFDSIYLVTKIVPLARKDELKRLRFNPHAKSGDENEETSQKQNSEIQIQQLTLTELLNDPQRFEGELIEISGLCTKVNTNIMDRNWIHLKADEDAAEELVATSKEAPAVGETIVLHAIVRLNKDFGAGYVYPILLEEAIMVQQ